MRTKPQLHSGLTLIEALIVIAVLAVLLAISLLVMGRTQARCCRLGCVNNVKQIGLAFRQWSLDNYDKFPTEISINDGGAMEWAQQGIAWRVFQVMSNELNTPKILFCPNDSNGKRVKADTFGSPAIASVSLQILFTNNQNLSYFASLDSDQTKTNLLLTGDSHLEVAGKELAEGLQKLSGLQKIGWSVMRHDRQGALCFADGSVRPFESRALPAVFKATGLATNRLAIP